MPDNTANCIISESRNCRKQKVNDDVFIIGSGNAEFKPEIEAIIGVLNGFGFQHSFALLNEREKGLDAFCDKICSKIKEAQFCIVLLNDPLSKFSDCVRVPSANVYYEFGLAVAQKKGVYQSLSADLFCPLIYSTWTQSYMMT
jgi:hypothetical protein